MTKQVGITVNLYSGGTQFKSHPYQLFWLKFIVVFPSLSRWMCRTRSQLCLSKHLFIVHP